MTEKGWVAQTHLRSGDLLSKPLAVLSHPLAESFVAQPATDLAVLDSALTEPLLDDGCCPIGSDLIAVESVSVTVFGAGELGFEEAFVQTHLLRRSLIAASCGSSMLGS